MCFFYGEKALLIVFIMAVYNSTVVHIFYPSKYFLAFNSYFLIRLFPPNLKQVTGLLISSCKICQFTPEDKLISNH